MPGPLRGAGPLRSALDLHLELPTCATSIFDSCATEHLAPAISTPLLKQVTHAYLIMYSRDRVRSVWQRVQLPQIGINTTIITGNDAEELGHRTLKCLFGSERPELSLKYASQLVKLWTAVYLMVQTGVSRALFFEDDVVVRFSHLASIDRALVYLDTHTPEWTGLFLSSYNPSGEDSLWNGLLPRRAGAPWIPYRAGGIMAGVGNVLSERGARHLLHSLPIRAHGLDAALSDSREPSAAADGGYFLKPYPFIAGAFGKQNLFECNFSVTCEKAFVKHFVTSAHAGPLRATELSQYLRRGWRVPIRPWTRVSNCVRDLSCSMWALLTLPFVSESVGPSLQGRAGGDLRTKL